MTWKPKLLSSLIALALFDVDAAVMREDVSVQDYRDFAENLGKYSPGKEGVEVLNKDGTPAGKLNFPIPDFSAIDSNGIATLMTSSQYPYQAKLEIRTFLMTSGKFCRSQII
ncbi:S6 family peptidase [Ewingella sp. CoE-038-23]|uniref:S6 family peptidase n=1 Tax=Ewingella docleensis TaxID=3118588 RepID=UPI0033658DAD